MRPVIILFAKAPVPGRVKTRLLERLSPDQAVELHSAFVRDTLEMLEGLFPRADIELSTDTLTDAWRQFGIRCHLQVDGDLGARMLQALVGELDRGRPQAMIIGSDSPTLPPAHLERLLASRADVALGPAEDGGYYAIACRKTHPAMFEGVEWSGPHALAHTVRGAERCGFTVELGDSWFDVDTPADLARLAGSASLPPHTGSWLEKHGKDILGGTRCR